MLAQYCGNTRYFEWYKRRRQHGDFVILDNGAYEQYSPNWLHYVKIANEMRPQVLTLPDIVGNAIATREATIRFLKDYVPMLKYSPQLMYVIQSENDNLLYWVNAYQWAVDQGAKWIALPRVMGSNRLALAAGLQHVGQWDPTINHHAFGMNNGDLEELPRLARLGFASCDSSAPIWRGAFGYPLGGKEPWKDIPFDPLAPIDPDYYELIDHNISEVLKRCHYESATPSATDS